MAEQEPVEKENIVELHAIEHDKIPAKEAEKSKAVSDPVLLSGLFILPQNRPARKKTKGCGCGGTAQLAGKHVVSGKMIAVELAGLAPRPKQPPHGILDARTA